MITYQGGEYDFDMTFMSVTMEEWREIKRKQGLTIRGVVKGVSELDPDAVTAVRWLVLRTCDSRVVLDPAAEFDVWEFLAAWKDADDAGEQAEPDPTQAGSPPDTSPPRSEESSTPTPENSSPGTSSGSRGSAESANGKPGSSPSLASSHM